MRGLQLRIINDDCLNVVKTFESESIDLIYLDPPFNTGKDWKQFDDRFKPDLQSRQQTTGKLRQLLDVFSLGYCDYMAIRLKELHRVLKPTGSLYLHCDWHAGHYLKVMLDEVFGYNNFVNEIIWCYASGGVSKRYFGKKHDNIYIYSKSKNYVFNTQYRPYTEGTLKRGLTQYKKDLNEAYELHDEGAVMNDWWTDITPLLSPTCFERLGYPTQKPLALLDRIIKASSNEGDIVLDPFCGCGTTIAVAERLKRRWIGIDINPQAVELTTKRLKDKEKYENI